jgi:hypothetical protein
VEEASLESLLAGSGVPAGADPELRPVADVLATLAGRPAGDELTGLADAQAEFRRRAAAPVQGRRPRRRRPMGLASRLGIRVCAAAAVVAMGLGGAAAAAYAGALPISWQQFAHRTIGTPVHDALHAARAATGEAGSSRHRPGSGNPAHRLHPGAPRGKHRPAHHTRPRHHASPPTLRPFVHLVKPPTAPVPGRWPPLSRNIPHWPTGTEQIGPSTSVSNAGSTRGVS